MPSGLRYVVADVFTDKPLEGNQLGVFLDARSLSSGQMQRLAREMNFAESVFVLPAESGGDARIRIFTPANELPFAGHPVLGSAFVVGELLPSNAVVRLETGVGLIPVELDRKGSQIVFGRMRQPIPSWSVYERQEELFAALGVKGSRLPVEAYKNGPLHVYVALESEEAVASLRPDMSALAELPAIGANCFAGAGRRWKTRMFAPAYGVPEDPATGSAAGPLAVHLARHGRISFGEEIEIRQGEEIRRPSILYARAEGSAERIERVEVGGSALIVARGEFERY
ncbi:MAG TPA: PhzF family phenazine biosynthesis protein [Myxococcales bacterium]|nr:PhzF family phenazine biosynthesis protein [Myxococcales bacterium]